jgi:undecaprenyl-diphosphatase
MLMAYSRIYLGVHFISDIVPGMLVGALFGYVSYALYMRFRPQPQLPCVYTPVRRRSIAAALLTTILAVILLSPWLTPLSAP